MSHSNGSFSTGRVAANGISLAYYRSGGSKPALVLAHGMTDMGLCWARVAQRLIHKYDVVLYDARGHGDSDAPPTGHDPLSRSEDLYGLILGLDLKKPRLLGHSLGAMTVGLLAANHPEMAHCIVLEDPPLPNRLDAAPEPAQVKQWDEQMLGWKHSIIEQLPQSRTELEAECRRQSPGWHDLEIAPWAEAKAKVSAHVFNIPNLMTDDWWHCLRRIKCPTLLLTAEPQRGALLSDRAEVQLRANVSRHYVGSSVRGRSQYSPRSIRSVHEACHGLLRAVVIRHCRRNGTWLRVGDVVGVLQTGVIGVEHVGRIRQLRTLPA